MWMCSAFWRLLICGAYTAGATVIVRFVGFGGVDGCDGADHTGARKQQVTSAVMGQAFDVEKRLNASTRVKE